MTRNNNDRLNSMSGQRPVTTGALPGDFVLHRAKDKGSKLISTAKEESIEFPVNYEDDMLEFDIDIPDDDDFDI
ncbi:MAG: hypothetical protein IJT63_01020 [Lachnospiraceae bacterium]|nr:hypothetical protein [Lachnospiraceae bacterium]